MKPLRISWLFKSEVGFYLILGLLLVATAFLAFSCQSWGQKLTAIVFILYFLLLLLKKYQANFQIGLIIVLLFAGSIYLSKKTTSFTLNAQSQIMAYPDQVKVKDNYLTGTGQFEQGQLLLSGKVTDQQADLIKKGQPLLLTRITGECLPIDPATNIGEFDYQNYYAAKKITQRLKFSSCDLQVVQTDSLLAKVHYLRFQLQNYFKKMPQLLGFFASELLLGENNATENQEILNNYRDLGVIHLLSISGLHVGIYVLIVSTICFSLKLTEKETFAACCAILIFGVFLSNGQAGFVRASLTYCLGQICKFKNYRIAQADLLGLTCILHLLVVPRLFMTAGAILSYVLVAGLKMTDKFGQIKQSIMLNVLLTPLLLMFFYQINFLTVLFNSLVVPYFNWVVMPLTFANLILFAFTKKLASFFEQVLQFGESVISSWSQTKLGLWTFGQINWWQCLLLLMVTVGLIIALREKTHWPIKVKQLIVLLMGIYATFFCIIHFPWQGQVTFIDVGQGDSILITTPFRRQVYLIDTGGKLNFSGKKTTPQINRITIPFLKSQGISEIDGLFVTHQDADHVGDLRPLLEQIHVKKMFMAQGLIKNPSFQKRIAGKVKRTELIELLAGMQVKQPQIVFNVVYPFQAGEGKNEDSLSLFFRLANKNWLFTGDLDQAGEKAILQKFNLKVDYFKLGHHGSKTSSNPEFLQAIQPEKVFISAGRDNRFGHPHQETLATLASQRISWASTQDCGMISWYYGGIGSPKFDYFLKRDK